eukprot:CAMPEP_0172313950 /NCGR_PEP_ID=MMETSP1058-20130122/21335_1 /TAXON_ID=83371 /ORGANISM="Detonula confervacea, Strain CCMP 353" /LENGTH=73 /DNA_ID=CAMNT_0013027693 /DNA_START=174 /DNA_END=391 /DNA_ORIENTATION=-
MDPAVATSMNRSGPYCEGGEAAFVSVARRTDADGTTSSVAEGAALSDEGEDSTSRSKRTRCGSLNYRQLEPAA